MAQEKRYYYKIFLRGGLGIDLVSTETSWGLWNLIGAAQDGQSHVKLTGFDDESEERPSAVVSFMPSELLAIVQRDLEMVQKQAAMQRLTPNGPRLL